MVPENRKAISAHLQAFAGITFSIPNQTPPNIKPKPAEEYIVEVEEKVEPKEDNKLEANTQQLVRESEVKANEAKTLIAESAAAERPAEDTH